MNHVTQLWCFINHVTLCLSRKTGSKQWFCSNTSKEVLKMGQFSTHNNLVQSSVLKNNNIIHKTNARLEIVCCRLWAIFTAHGNKHIKKQRYRSR